MAIPGGLWSAYGITGPATGIQYGVREDVSDTLTIIDPEEFPTVAILQHTTTKGLYHEWETYRLAATSTGGAVQGDTWSISVSGTANNKRVRYGNWVQHFRKDFGVSLDTIKLSQNGQVIGTRNEMDLEATSANKEILRNIDARTWSNGTACQAATGADATVQLMANIRGINGTAQAIADCKTITQTAAGSFSTANLYSLHQSMWATGAKPDTLFVNTFCKMNVSRTLLGDSAYNTTVPAGGLSLVKADGFIGGGEYGPVIDFIKTDYGRLAVVMDRWMPRSTASAALAASAIQTTSCWALIEKSKVRLAYWRPLQTYPVAPQGDFMAAYSLAALTLEYLHPSCIGLQINATD